MLNPQEAFAIALQHHQAGRLAEAEPLYRQILATHPKHPDALHYLGVLSSQMGHHDRAVELICQAIALDPNNPALHTNLGVALAEQGRFEDASSAYARALELEPDLPEVQNNLGYVLREQGRLEEAMARLHRALELKPDYAEAYNNLGNALVDQGRLEEAMAAYQRAIELKPNFPTPHKNLGDALASLGDFPAADAAFHQALAIDPHYAGAKFCRSLLLLRSGDFRHGFPLYEARHAAISPKKPTFSQPQWDGQTRPGQRVLVHAEQGFGDTIQFVRYASSIAARGGEVIVEAPRELVALLLHAKDVTAVLASGSTLPQFDFHLPMLSQPLVFETTLQTIPGVVPYIFAEQARREIWAHRLGCGSRRLKVGLAWASNPRNRLSRTRDIPLAQLLPLLHIEGVDFFSLQVERGAEQICGLPAASAIIDHTVHCQDFADTAALVMELDLVISVDTATTHLAGAMGKPIWTLLSYVADWRWGLESETTPWYPTMRLFRQQRRGEWEDVIQLVAAELLALAGNTAP